MKDLNISLLREKFVIHDPKALPNKNKGTVVAVSNRIELELEDAKGKVSENFVIRTQNMHSCARLAAKIIAAFIAAGSIMDRPKPIDWEAIWDSLVNDYEYGFNPDRWAAVYHNGKIVFQSGEHHPLLDLIEKCDSDNNGAYEDSIPVAEDAFKKTGKVVKIEYDGNVALVVNLDKKQGRCGIILRGADKTTTFNFSANAPKDKSLNYAQCLNAAAAFLEGIQLAFMIGMNTVKLQMRILDRHSHEEKQTHEAKRRLSRLTAEIASFESTFDVRYRPEKPEFNNTTLEAEKLAAKTLEPKPKK